MKYFIFLMAILASVFCSCVSLPGEESDQKNLPDIKIEPDDFVILFEPSSSSVVNMIELNQLLAKIDLNRPIHVNGLSCKDDVQPTVEERLRLAESRALEVKKYLVQNGVQASLITTLAFNHGPICVAFVRQ